MKHYFGNCFNQKVVILHILVVVTVCRFYFPLIKCINAETNKVEDLHLEILTGVGHNDIGLHLI